MPHVTHPVTEPFLDDDDRRHVLDAFDSGWISSQGPYLERFEREFAAWLGVPHALTCCNGTAALHLALLALGVKPGDEVIVPTLTYVATANAVAYCGATPVLVDCEDDTWNLDPVKVRAAITSRTVGIIAVHLYGHPCDMELLGALTRHHGLWLVEDAAEAHGAEYHGRKVGTFGDVATFSLFGNKVITTGEGGMVVTRDADLAARIHLFRGQGMDPKRRYWFPAVGYNYRMTNVAAALGCSQLAKLDELVERHRRVAGWYQAALADVPGIVHAVERPGCRNVHWLTSVRIAAAEDAPGIRDDVMAGLLADGIDTRPFFYPMHIMPVYEQTGDFAVAERMAASGLNLPSSPKLARADVEHVAARLRHHVNEAAFCAMQAAAGPANSIYCRG